jgi:hypothetical protein
MDDLDREWRRTERTFAFQMERFHVQAAHCGETILAAVPTWMHPGLRMLARFLWG